MDRLRALMYGTVLLLCMGWLLHIGKSIFVPAVLGAVIVYIIVGLAQALGRLPGLGPVLPSRLRYLISFAVIGLIGFLFAYLVMANRERALALAPQYQQSLLAAIQRVAVYFGFETEPTWATLRQDLLARIDLRRLFGSLLTSVGSVVLTFVVVCLYATFLLLERRNFEAKLANLSDDPARVARIRQVIGAINQRIGSYLALKTLISVLLGVSSYVVMRLFGLEFAALWAVLIAVLNFVPYVGSVLGVVLPMLMTIVQFEDLGTILTMLLSLTALQFVIGNFLDPYVMGNSLNLSPFAILVSLAVWSELWGVPGAFLAVPITAILTIVFSEFPGTRPIAVLLSRGGKSVTRIVVLLAMLLPAAVFAADGGRRFAELGAGRGLDARVAVALLVDRNGLLWVGSREGLFRYDGYQASAFLPDPDLAGQISDIDVRALYEADDGALWISTSTGGLNRRDPRSGAFTQFHHQSAVADSLSDESVYGIAQDAEGRLWVGTQHGLNRLDQGGRRFERHFHEPGRADSIANDWVYALHRGPTGTLWVGTVGGGLGRWTGTGEALRTWHSRPSPAARADSTTSSPYTRRPTVTLLFTVREESGLQGARFMDPAVLKGAAMCFNVDSKGPADLITGGVAAERWDVDIVGRAAHAGVAPEKGISATLVASIALAEAKRGGWIGKVTKGKRRGTSNPGIFGGKDGAVAAGNATNVVTDFVYVRGETRSVEAKFASAITAAYKAAFVKAGKQVKDDKGGTAKVRFTSRAEYPSFNLDDNSPAVVHAKKAAVSLSLKPRTVFSNGGLDANWFVKYGLPTVTIGAGQYEVHTLKEYVNLAEYVDGCRLAVALATLA